MRYLGFGLVWLGLVGLLFCWRLDAQTCDLDCWRANTPSVTDAPAPRDREAEVERAWRASWEEATGQVSR